MKPKTLILMLVAVGCGLAAAFLAMTYGGATTTPDTEMIVVAKVPLKIGDVIKDADHLQTIPYPKALVTDKHIRNPADLNGKSIGTPLDVNEPVMLKHTSQAGNIFHGETPEGTRAFTIRVSLESAIAGFLMPGSKIDLFCALQNIKDARIKSEECFMQDKLVLAVNAEQKPPPGAPVIPNPTVVTLALTVEEALRVAWVTHASGSQVAIALRKPGDTKTYDDLPKIVSPHGTEGTKDTVEAKVPTVEVPVAKQDILPGSVIIDENNVDEYFKLVRMPKSFVPAEVLEHSQIRGQINQFAAKGLPLTAAHLVVVPGVGPVAQAKGHSTMTIRIGLQPDQRWDYDANGKLIDGSNPGAVPAPGPGGDGRERLPAPPGAAPKASEGPKEI